MKRISSTVLSLALVLSVVAPVAAGAQSMSGTFNTTLTVGSTGSAVVALQSFLVSKGLLTMPAGVSMGSFRGLTKSAVAAYQISKGIQPSAGYFGPMTRAAANADSVGGTTTTTTTTPGCSAGALFNSMTG
ncbi:MAG: peptidoglycan-binding domain-containing protein, partial [bacterium]